MAEVITIKIPNFQKWQRRLIGSQNHAQYIAFDVDFYSDPKIEALLEKDPVAVHVFLWILTELGRAKAEEITLHRDSLAASLRKVTRKRSNNFQPEKYLNLLSTFGLLSFNLPPTTRQLASNLPSTGAVEQAETRAPVISNIEKKEEKKKEEKSCGASAPTTPRGTRLEKKWTPSPELLAWAKEERPDIDLSAEMAAFVDYWIAQPGQRGLKLDWDATFRNWIRRCNSGRSSPARPRFGSNIPAVGISEKREGGSGKL